MTETEIRFPDISPDIFRPPLLEEMRFFMQVLPGLALFAYTLSLSL